MTISQAFREGLREEMERDDTIFVMGTDLFIRGGHWGQVKGLGEMFGRERIRDTPISEAAMVAAGVGASLYGTRPVVDLNFADFVFGAMDEVVNQAAKIRYMWSHDVPVVVRATNGVAFGAAQHNNSLESWFAHTPGLVVATPATPADTKALIKTALRGRDPVIFLMHKMLSGVRGEVGGIDDLVPIGKAATTRTGKDVTIVGYSVTAKKALDAAAQLAAEGLDAEVIDLRSVAPIDYETVAASVRRTGRLVVVGEAPLAASVVADVASSIGESEFMYLDAPIRRVGSRHTPIPHSPPLFESVIPQIEDIITAVYDVLS